MDYLLEASSNPFWVFIAFFLSTAIAHYIGVYWRPLTLKQWRLVDYMWLMLAMVSIYGFVEEARFFRAQATMEISRTTAESNLARLESWFEVYGDYACEEKQDNDAYLAFCHWLKQHISDLDLITENEEFPADIPANFLLGLSQVSADISDDEIAIQRQNLKAYRNARESFLMSARTIHISTISGLLVALAPLLFAIAIGIKIAKVTGEYRLTKH